MADKAISLRIPTSAAVQDLQPLKAEIASILADLQKIAASLGGANESPTAKQDFFQGAAKLEAFSKASNALQGSATPDQSPVETARAGALQGLSPFSNLRRGGIGAAGEIAGIVQPYLGSPEGAASRAIMPGLFGDPAGYAIGKPAQNQIIQQVISSVQSQQTSAAAITGQPVVGGAITGGYTATMQFSPQMQAAIVGSPAVNITAGSVPNGWSNVTNAGQTMGMPAGGGNGTWTPQWAWNNPAGGAVGGGGGFGGAGGGVGVPAGGIPAGGGGQGGLGPGQVVAGGGYTTRLSLQRGVELGVGTIALGSVSDYAAYQTHLTLEGGPGRTAERASAISNAVATSAGLIVGAGTGNPYAALGTMGIVRSLADPIAQYFVRDQVAREGANIVTSPILGAMFTRGGTAAWRDYFQKEQPVAQIPSHAGGLIPGRTISKSREQIVADMVNKGIDGAFITTVPKLGASLASVASGLLAGGMDPFSQGPDSTYNPTIQPYNLNGQSVASYDASVSALRGGRNGGLINGLIEQTRARIQSIGVSLYKGQTLAESYRNRIAMLFPSVVEEVGKQQGEIMGSLPETGGNIADILAKFGPEATSNWLRIQDDSGVGAVGPRELSRTSAAIRSSARGAAINALQTTYSGSGTQRLLGRELDQIASLPGGRNSLEYAQQFAAYRAAGKTAFEQEQTITFGVPMAHLEGAIERSNVLPFNPSNRYGLEMNVISRSEREVRRLQNFMGARRASGQLSEDEELELTQRIEGLKTREAEGVAKLSDGLDDRLPGLSAGRPNSFRRFDSFQLAAMSLMRQGSPIRSYGALNGAQRQMQEDFTLSFGAGNTGPYDRTMQMDNHAVVGGMQNLVGALNNLASKMGGGTTLGAGTTVNNNSAGGGNNNRPQGNNGGNSQQTSATTPDQQRTYINGQVQTQQQYLLPNNTNGRAQGYN